MLKVIMTFRLHNYPEALIKIITKFLDEIKILQRMTVPQISVLWYSWMLGVFKCTPPVIVVTQILACKNLKPCILWK